jgi:hypothetical protein
MPSHLHQSLSTLLPLRLVLAALAALAALMGANACAPSLTPSIHQQDHRRLVLGPQKRQVKLPFKAGRGTLAVVELATPGSLRLEQPSRQSLSVEDQATINENQPTETLWLGRSRYARREQGLSLGDQSVGVAAGTWYIFAADPPPAVGITLHYLPPWHPIEAALLAAGTDTAPPDHHHLASLRMQLAPHQATYPAPTEELAAELMRRQTESQIDAALIAPQEQAIALLSAAAARIDSLAPAHRPPLRRNLEQTRQLNSPRYLQQALYTQTTAELLRHCLAPTTDTTSPDDEALCQLLELVRADELLEQADATLVTAPSQADSSATQALALLERRPGPGPGPLAWEKAQESLIRAQRNDLLGRAVALSKSGLYTRLRHQRQAAPLIANATEHRRRFNQLRRRAEEEATAEAYIAAISLGREALAAARHDASIWNKIGHLSTLEAAARQTAQIHRDTTLLHGQTRIWESYVDYRLSLENWRNTLRRAENTTDPATAAQIYSELEEMEKTMGHNPPAPIGGASTDNLRQRTRAEKTRLGLLALDTGVVPTNLDQMDYEELTRRYRLAGQIFVEGTDLPAAVATRLQEKRAALLRTALERAQSDLDRDLQARRWQAASAHAARVEDLAPAHAAPLRQRIALQQARHLRDRAQLALERAFVSDALALYEEALEILAPHGSEPAVREVRDFVQLEIANLRSQHLALVRLETEVLPLARCLGTGQPLPQSMPFTLIVRRGLVALDHTDADAYVRAYDIELVLPKEDFTRLSITPLTADKEHEIPTEYTDLLDGRISLVLRTAGLEEATQIQITFSGGSLDLESIGRRWLIHKGLHL